MDSMEGYVSGAAINAFEIRFKWFTSTDELDESKEKGNELRLESLSLFKYYVSESTTSLA